MKSTITEAFLAAFMELKSLYNPNTVVTEFMFDFESSSRLAASQVWEGVRILGKSLRCFESKFKWQCFSAIAKLYNIRKNS